MKCTYCGFDTRVLATRKIDSFTTQRRHACIADPAHRFNTLETPENLFGRPRHIHTSAKALEAKLRRVKRDDHIRQNINGLSNVQLARKYGVTETRVRQIKKGGR
jgi:transcriptional regulator NrdR family protein